MCPKPFSPKTRITEHWTVYHHPLVALPHRRFTFSAIITKWEGDFQPDVALPLIVQPAKNSKSDVGVRLIRGKKVRGKRQEIRKKVSIDLYRKPLRPETRNAEHWTRNAYPFSRTPTSKIHVSAINTKWEGDIGLYVALPLLDQPVNDSASEVGVRLKEFEEFEVWKV